MACLIFAQIMFYFESQGDRWEGLGSIASVAIPLFIVFAVAVGFFAAQTYNQDATVFLENAKSPEDTAKLYTFNSE